MKVQISWWYMIKGAVHGKNGSQSIGACILFKQLLLIWKVILDSPVEYACFIV